MYVLDTNVLSELMKMRPIQPVFDWVAGHPASIQFATTVSQAEVFAGIFILPQGRRRSGLEAAAHKTFSEDFHGRVLPFDADAAMAFADILTVRRKAGRPIATIDLMIASIARARAATVVTRDVGGFQGCGVALINPWTATGS